MKPLDVLNAPSKLDGIVDRRISADDQMFGGDEERYLAVGRDAITKIVAVQAMVGADEPRSVLDFACGHGRVGRYLRAAFPDAELVGADVMARALPHYQEVCEATVVQTDPHLDDVELGTTFDLIWSGSLMTHLNETAARALLRLFDRHLVDGGLVVLTTHGRFVASRWRTGEWPYQLTGERLRELSDLFDAGEYAYSDYAHMKNYGISMTPLAWIMRAIEEFPQLRLVGMMERGWDDHQDLVALRRLPVR